MDRQPQEWTLTRANSMQGRDINTGESQKFFETITRIKEEYNLLWSDSFHEATDPITYGNELFLKLVDQLGPRQTHASSISMFNYEWLLPKRNTTAEELVIFDRIHQCAPLISDDEVKKILPLEEAPSYGPIYPAGVYFFFQSFELDEFELERVIAELENSDEQCRETDEWKSILSRYRSGERANPEKFTLRGFGSFEGPGKPYESLASILQEAVEEAYIYPGFIRALTKLYPKLMEQASTWLIRDASIGANHDRTRDETNTFLHQFFHAPSLLTRTRNDYAGGCPNLEDAQLFVQLEIDIWSRFDEMSRMLEQSYSLERSIANGFNHTTNLVPRRVSAPSEAVPRTYRGVTLAVFIGSDDSMGTTRSKQGFLEGCTRGGKMTKEMMERIVSSRSTRRSRFQNPTYKDGQGQHGRAYRQDRLLFRSFWCYLNISPEVQSGSCVDIHGFVHQYLEATMPLIVVTYGRLSTNSVRSKCDMTESFRTSANDFISSVGKPTLESHRVMRSVPNSLSKVAQQEFFISIPHIDPSRDRYGKAADSRIRRLINITMYNTLHISKIAMDIIDATITANGILPPRQELCMRILRAIVTLAQRPPYRTLLENLNKARQDCYSQ